jgi:hypothetical protein
MFFLGNFALISPASLLQVLCQEERSVHVSGWCGGSQVSVQIREGQIIQARCDCATGAEAIYQVLTWNSGQFRLEEEYTPIAPPHITASLSDMMLEAARRNEQPATNTRLLHGPSRQQLIALLEVCPALAGVATIGYDGQMLADVEFPHGLVPCATNLALSLATVSTACGGEGVVALYIHGSHTLLLADWGDQTLVLGIPSSDKRLEEAISQLASWTTTVTQYSTN